MNPPQTAAQKPQAAGLSNADLLSQAEADLRAGRFDDAAKQLGRVIHRDTTVHLLHTFARNLATLKTHQPDLVAPIASADDTDRYQITPTDAGLTVVRTTDHAPQPLSNTTLDQIQPTLDKTVEEDQPITLAGLGDGALLAHLAINPPDMLHTQQQVVYVVEPDLALVRLVMMTRDLTGAIAQPRIQWCLGPNAGETLERLLIDTPHLLTPSHVVFGQPTNAALVDRLITPAAKARNQHDANQQLKVNEWDAAQSADRLAELFGDNPPRPPRALLFTSRFTTVLQYATADTAHAFEQIGWETQTLIEPADHLRCNASAVLDSIAAFKPDLIFQIDHLRSEFNGLIPDNIPFVCWVQDHLPNLITPAAGKTVKLRDYVLTAVADRYSREYRYPADRCIALSKLTRLPQLPAASIANGEDLVFVSNASTPTDQLIEDIVDNFRHQPIAAAMVEDCCRCIAAVYDRDEALPAQTDIQRILEQTELDHTGRIDDTVKRDALVHILFNQLNNNLYRQQAIAWAADIAEQLDLNLCLYGHGWENHPRFAPHARGPVAYGQPLQQLTRRARVNLQVVPFQCTHQRLLDGIAAGGFFLVRNHPFDRLAQRIAAHLTEQPDTQRAADLPDDLQSDAAPLHWIGDPVAVVRDWLACGLVRPDTTALPDLDAVGFDCADSLRNRIETFIHDDDARAAITDRQRRYVADTFSYTAGIGRIVREIRQKLKEET